VLDDEHYQLLQQLKAAKNRCGWSCCSSVSLSPSLISTLPAKRMPTPGIAACLTACVSCVPAVRPPLTAWLRQRRVCWPALMRGWRGSHSSWALTQPAASAGAARCAAEGEGRGRRRRHGS
jgi:hypothetical protein